MKFGSLFTGIGGIDLGLERAGMECAWQVEIDPFCQKVLAKHWPEVARYEDIREVGSHNLGPVDLICGGFPCQDISYAGKGSGLSGERSGLWREMLRTIRMVRPRLALVENVAALLRRGMGRVLGDMAESGYDAEWDCLPAAAFGARHFRERVFIIATPGVLANTPIINQGDMGRLPPSVERWRRLGEPNSETGWLWPNESGVGRRAYGVPRGVDRLRCLGNAVVPQVAEWMGRRLIDSTGGGDD